MTDSEVHLTVNGVTRSARSVPDRSLLVVLRSELGLTGAKFGCGEGECGACTVLLDGIPVRACQVRIGEADGKIVTTVEGLERDGNLNVVQQAFVELGAFQCGYCTPGMVVRTTALLKSNPSPTEAEIRSALETNICRCGGYARILRAVERAAERSRAAGGGE
jgi:aerobic-type carbon monoxide dehydrogenase small subunit (CoxS/CutS family)